MDKKWSEEVNLNWERSVEFLADIEAVTPLCPVFIECHQEALVSLLTDPLSSLSHWKDVAAVWSLPGPRPLLVMIPW